jgi:integrase
VGRRRKDENIYRRGKVWYIRFCFRDREYRESSKSEDRKVAKALFEQRRREIEEGRFGGPKAERTKFEDLEKLILRDYDVNGRKSVKSLTDRIASLRQTFGNVRAVDVTYASLDEYVDKRRREGAKPATIRYELVVFGRMFTLGIKAKMLVSKPLLPTIKVENARTGFFEDDEIARVIAHLPPHLGALVEFLSLTGWRKSEATGLTWAQIDMDAGVVRLEPGTTKSGEGRVFPFLTLPRLGYLLVQQGERHLAWQKEHKEIVRWVFPRPDGRRIGQFHKEWSRACKAAAVIRMVHDMRRSAVRRLVRAEVNEKVAMALAGFKTRSVFDRYNIISEADLAEGVAKLANRSSGA